MMTFWRSGGGSGSWDDGGKGWDDWFLMGDRTTTCPESVIGGCFAEK